MAEMTEHDPTTDERFQVAAQGVPGAMPVGTIVPDAGDVVSSGGLTPDGRKAEGGISGSSVRIGDRVFKGLAAGSGGIEELYDYRSDPLELTNVAGDPAQADQLAWMRARTDEQCQPRPPGYVW